SQWPALDRVDADVMYIRLREAWVLDAIEKLILLRREAGLTREHLATLLGVTEDYIKRVEMKELVRSVPLELLFKWMWQCGVVPGKLQFEERNDIWYYQVDPDQEPNL
ncbi:MAG TPA: helix-turn-helix transcriptional regulator, partial [Ktedonobacteraceae bacterium]